MKNGDEAYENASKLMDGFVAMLRLVGGNNNLHKMVLELSMDVSSGEMEKITPVIPIPNQVGEPAITIEVWRQFNEITNAVASLNEPKRSRIALAAQLIEKAYSERDAFKFISYWVALEVAAKKNSKNAIISILVKAYNRSKSYIQNDLGFDHFWNTRTALIHKGENYAMPPDVERYFQCMFLDLVRESLNLDCLENMTAMVESGFNVRRIDRTVAQENISTFKL